MGGRMTRVNAPSRRISLVERRRRGSALWATLQGDVSGFLPPGDSAYNMTYSRAAAQAFAKYGIFATRHVVCDNGYLRIESTLFINYVAHADSLYSTGLPGRVVRVHSAFTSVTELSPPDLRYETTISVGHTRKRRAWGHV